MSTQQQYTQQGNTYPNQPIYQRQPQSQQDQVYYTPNPTPAPHSESYFLPQAVHPSQEPGAVGQTHDPITPLPRYTSPPPVKDSSGMGSQPQAYDNRHSNGHPHVVGTHVHPASELPQALVPAAQNNANGIRHGVPSAQYLSTPTGLATSRASMVYKPVIHTTEPFHYSMCGCIGDFFKCNKEKMNTWCCAYWCPCVLYSRIHYRLRSENPLVIDDHGFSYCNGFCWAYMCLGALPLNFAQRNELRHKYKLEGSCTGDKWRHCMCSTCSLCQEEKEIIFREKQLNQLVQAHRYENNAGMSMNYVPQEKQ